MAGGAADAFLRLDSAVGLDGRLLPAPMAGLVLVAYTALALTLALLFTPRRDVL